MCYIHYSSRLLSSRMPWLQSLSAKVQELIPGFLLFNPFADILPFRASQRGSTAPLHGAILQGFLILATLCCPHLAHRSIDSITSALLIPIQHCPMAMHVTKFLRVHINKVKIDDINFNYIFYWTQYIQNISIPKVCWDILHSIFHPNLVCIFTLTTHRNLDHPCFKYLMASGYNILQLNLWN